MKQRLQQEQKENPCHKKLMNACKQQMIKLVRKYDETILAPKTSSLVCTNLCGHCGKRVLKRSDTEADSKIFTRNFSKHEWNQ